MYYEFLIAHLDAPILLLSAVTTGLFIKIFYNSYIKTIFFLRVMISIVVFLLNAIIIVPGIVFLYRWALICVIYNPNEKISIFNLCKNAFF